MTCEAVGRRLPLLLPLAAAAGCAGEQDALAPAGRQAATIAELFWHYQLPVSVAVYVLVIAAMLYAVLHRGARATLTPPTPEDAALPEERALTRRLTRAVGSAVAVTVLLLFGYLVYDFATGHRLAALGLRPGPTPLIIEVTGHQWWWEVAYEDTSAHGRVTTANEIHVPVGRPVMVKIASQDVIHSFWAPNLLGKKDLIPGHQTSTWFVADTPGVYRGQCAEFCGFQHAKMAFFIVADPPRRFASWLAQQRSAAAEPTDSVARRGREVFLAGSCALCHSVQGTLAHGVLGPDLTHVGSRMTIAAGTLPNTRGNLAGWILDPQRIKPGANMPPNQLQPADLQALLTYLESLK